MMKVVEGIRGSCLSYPPSFSTKKEQENGDKSAKVVTVS